MPITWFTSKEEKGSVSFYSNYLTLNTVACSLLGDPYKVEVGCDPSRNALLIKPISKERYLRGDLDENLLLPFNRKASYGRVASVQLLNRIQETFHLKLGKSPLKAEAVYDVKEGCLVIAMKGGCQ